MLKVGNFRGYDEQTMDPNKLKPLDEIVPIVGKYENEMENFVFIHN